LGRRVWLGLECRRVASILKFKLQHRVALRALEHGGLASLTSPHHHPSPRHADYDTTTIITPLIRFLLDMDRLLPSPTPPVWSSSQVLAAVVGRAAPHAGESPLTGRCPVNTCKLTPQLDTLTPQVRLTPQSAVHTCRLTPQSIKRTMRRRSDYAPSTHLLLLRSLYILCRTARVLPLETCTLAMQHRLTLSP
jgi:hypothetical protein